MPRVLKILLLLTDWGFILYWSITALASFNIINLPPSWLFKDYHDPNIVAWNWSFMPLDLLASATGLWALHIANRGEQWRSSALISITLTFCAGFLALSFWTFQRSFDLGWWVPNLFLMLWPLFMLQSLRTET